MEFKKYNKNKDINQVYDFDKFNQQIKEKLKPTHTESSYSSKKHYNLIDYTLGADELSLNPLNLKSIYKKELIDTTPLKKQQLQNQINEKDVLTIRYCNNPFTCQNLASNKVPGDFQVNLSSSFKFYTVGGGGKGNKNINIEDDLDENQKKINLDVTTQETPKITNNNYHVYNKIANQGGSEDGEDIDTSGDDIKIIGFFRLPIKSIYSISDYGTLNILNKTYTNDAFIKYTENNYIKIVEVDDTYANNSQSLFFKHPNNPVIFLFVIKSEQKSKTDNKKNQISKKNKNYIYHTLGKILPSFDDIINYHSVDFNDYQRNNVINNVIELYGYDRNNLNVHQIGLINNIHERNYKKESKKISNYIEHFDLQDKSLKKNKSQSKVVSKKYEISDILMEELGKISKLRYTYENSSIDNSRLRFEWIVSNIDNGLLFLSYSQVLELYNQIDVHTKTEGLNLNIDKLNKEIELLKLENTDTTNLNKSCNNLNFGKVKIVKYKTLKDLEKDNGVDITDSDEQPITDGDFAILEVTTKDTKDTNNTKSKDIKVYKRTEILGVDQWVLDNKKSIHDILELEKQQFYDSEASLTKGDYDYQTNKCNTIYSDYFNFDLNEPNCAFDTDDMKCLNLEASLTASSIKQKEESIQKMEGELVFCKNIEKEKKDLEKRLKHIRTEISNTVQKKSHIQKHKLEKNKQLAVEVQQLIKGNTPCVHFDMLRFIGKIKNTTEIERFQYYRLVIDNYLNTNYILDLDKVIEDDEESELVNFGRNQNHHSNKHSKNDKHKHKHSTKESPNYTTCNICSQNLVCKHWLTGIKMLETDGDIDFGKLTDIYGIESNGIYTCKICGEFIANTETIDIIEGGRGADNKGGAFREVLKDDKKNDKKIQLLDQYLKNLEQDEKYDTDTYFKMEFYYHLKQLLNIKVTDGDEKEMIIFINTHNFIKREVYYHKIRVTQPTLPLKIVHTLVQTNYQKRICCDIAARFLIILQTSQKEYVLKNQFCSPNFIGFPLIDNINERDGIKLIFCICQQLATKKKYKFLEKNIEKMIIDKLYYFLENDEFVKNKILKTIDDKTNMIFNHLDFNNYENKYWPACLPFLGVDNLEWKPEKKLLKSELSSINSRNYSKMKNTCYENLFYYTYQSVILINDIIGSEIARNKFFRTTSITNSCCIEQIKPTNYLNYFYQKDNNIKKYIEAANEMYLNYEIINKFKVHPIYKVNTKLYLNTSLKVTPLHFNIDAYEIKQFFIKFIDKGAYQGKEHVYNEYGVCIITNEQKENIENNIYTIHDYNRLSQIIYKNNIVSKEHLVSVQDKDKDKYKYKNTGDELNNTDKSRKKPVSDYNPYTQKNFKNKKETIDFLDYLITTMEDHPKLKLLSDQLETLKRNYEVKEESRTKFNFYLKLVGQTNINIKKLCGILIKKSKDIEKFKNNLVNLGFYENLYNEKVDKNESVAMLENFKNKTKEKKIKKDFKYLLESIVMLKNRKYKYIKNADEIPYQYQYLLLYKDYNTIFEDIYKKMDVYNHLFKVIEGQMNSYFPPDYSSIILHYLLVEVLFTVVNIETVKQKDSNKTTSKKKINKHANKVANYIKEQDKLVKESTIRDGDDDGEDGEDDEKVGNIVVEKEDFDLVKNKSKVNYYITSEFIVVYLKFIFKRQANHDSLTDEKIKQRIADTEQKQQRRNLKIHQILKTEEGMDEYRNMILQKLHYGMLEYHSLENEISNLGLQEHLDNYDNESVERDEMTDKEFYNQDATIDKDNDVNYNDGNIIYDADEDDVEDGDYIF